MVASLDGLVYRDSHAECSSGMLELKYHYVRRDMEIDSDEEWHYHLFYFICIKELKKIKCVVIS